MMCFKSSKMISHLSICCEVAWHIWNSFFGFFSKSCPYPAGVEAFLVIKSSGLRRQKDQIVLWHCPIFVGLWCLWLEQTVKSVQSAINSFSQVFSGRGLFLCFHCGFFQMAFLGGCPSWIFKGIEKIFWVRTYVVSYVLAFIWGGFLVLYFINFCVILSSLRKKIIFHLKKWILHYLFIYLFI